MADKLTLHGATDIKGHTGTDMRRVNPKRGGSTHQIKQWWSKNAKNTVYVDCLVLLVTRTGGNVKLAVPITESTRLTISYDGSDDFTFSGILNVDRIGVFDESMVFIEEYRLPHIVGGKQMKVTPAGNTLPGGGGSAVIPSIGNLNIAGNASPVSSNAETYTATPSGNPTSPTYAWTTTDTGAIFTAQTSASTDVTFSGPGTFDLVCTVTDSASSDSPKSETFGVTAS